MSGICERGFMLMLKKIGILGALSELLKPHLFGRTGALKFGTIGLHQFLYSIFPGIWHGIQFEYSVFLHVPSAFTLLYME